MKKILVYDIAAESGGAKTVLDAYYDKYKNDSTCECYFVLSKPDYPENERVHVIKLPWTKKSWFHRLYCDYIYMPRLIKKVGIEEVLSLQNIGIPGCKVFQTVYVHNAIPFTEHRFSLRKDPFLWVYQNVIGRMTYHSLKHADKIIVQTEWMKEKIVNRCKVAAEKISVERVMPKQHETVQRSKTQHPIFFYPATPYRFKNIDIIVEACKRLKAEGIEHYEVVLTIEGAENKIAAGFMDEAKRYGLPIKFVGRLKEESMKDYYSKSILLFPSYLETVGLPLIEAQAFHAPILAADCLYAHEAVGTYQSVTFFPYSSDEKLAEEMKAYIENQGDSL